MAESVASYALVALGSLLSIVDPIAAAPAYLGLTAGLEPAARRRAAFVGSFTCFGVLTTFGFAGTLIFKFFGISIPAFKVAGGLVLFGTALQMMGGDEAKSRTTEEEREEAHRKNDVGLMPLGIPLLAGPGSIASVMVLAERAETPTHHAVLHACVAIVAFGTYLTLRGASGLSRVLGQTGINLVSRLMGLVLAAVAVEFVLGGLRDAFPRLFGA